jgi:uncharacterized membrane protein YkgB
MNSIAKAASTANGPRIQRLGRVIATIGIILPLLFIGGLKFTPPEIEALKGLIGMAPWLSWLYPLFGEAGASYFLGIVEIAAALLLIASFRTARAGLLGALLATLTFVVTSSLLLLPIAWDDSLGGFPALSPLGQFLIKDIALLGVALIVAGESLTRVQTAPLTRAGGVDEIEAI